MSDTAVAINRAPRRLDAGPISPPRSARVVGVVQESSIKRIAGDPTVTFTVGDDSGTVPVVYKGER